MFKKFAHLSIGDLIDRIEDAPDFGYDDESVELSHRLAERNQDWKWSDDFFNPSIIIFDKE